MKIHLEKSRNRTGRISRLKLTTVLVAALVLAIAAVTVVSRQRASANGTERNAQVAEKSNYMKVKVAGQDVEVDQNGKIKTTDT